MKKLYFVPMIMGIVMSAISIAYFSLGLIVLVNHFRYGTEMMLMPDSIMTIRNLLLILIPVFLVAHIVLLVITGNIMSPVLHFDSYNQAKKYSFLSGGFLAISMFFTGGAYAVGAYLYMFHWGDIGSAIISCVGGIGLMAGLLTVVVFLLIAAALIIYFGFAFFSLKNAITADEYYCAYCGHASSSIFNTGSKILDEKYLYNDYKIEDVNAEFVLKTQDGQEVARTTTKIGEKTVYGKDVYEQKIERSKTCKMCKNTDYEYETRRVKK